MSKLVVMLVASLCLLAFPTSTFAFTLGTDYYETIDVSGNTYTSTIEFENGFIGWLSAESWGHTLSSDFMTVPDDFTVSSAALQISGWHSVGTGQNLVSFAGEFHWTAYEGWTWTWAATENLFDLTNIDHNYWNMTPLAVSLTPIHDLGVHIGTSVLTVDYANVGSPGDVSAVPEPTTLLLLGSGLLGAGYFGRRK
ncbi:MAG: PEP-CTERM sorting domain-containing protein [bacterium]|nr:PEP-CTERM sorting domain-containing protein [bacterium]